jgi:hypothetical protein
MFFICAKERKQLEFSVNIGKQSQGLVFGFTVLFKTIVE